MGNSPGEIHSVASGSGLTDDSPRNSNNYRITDEDRLGAGGPKQKFQQNFKVVQIVHRLIAENRKALPDEKAMLVKYVGWGAMPQVFDAKNQEWKSERKALQEQLPDGKYEQIRSTTLNAHYTSPTVIRAMYQAAQRFGFQGGNILEPASGIGHFIGLMPAEMLERSSITGVEIDPLSARIAKELYPDADIRAEPFEKSKLPAESFDLAISNVPFGDYRVHDPRWNKHKFPIHDYFFAAAFDKVKPGGMVMFITSHHTLDKLDVTLRDLLASKAELLGAIRLPNNAFKKNAGTEVTADIVMLRKLRAGEQPSGPAWKVVVDFTNEQKETFSLNEYFVAHPEMMLGNMRLARGLYRNDEPTLEPDGRELGEALAQAVTKLPQNIYEAQNQPVAKQTFDVSVSSGVRVSHVDALGSWVVRADWEVKHQTANTTDWGTSRYSGIELIKDTLNLKTPTVYDYVDKKPVVNAAATEAAREKQERIKERFKTWIWADDHRRERLVRLYNDSFNHTRLRTFNGQHLTLPGASSTIRLDLHQKTGVWRILQTPNTLLAHVVGAGKTYTMVAAAMELKRLSLARKPMFVVPNHMLGQFSTELLTLYPGANILVAGKEDFTADNRKKLFSRIATGNWDAVIVTHSGFERIPISEKAQTDFFKEQLAELEKVKLEHADSDDRSLVKEIEKAKKRLEAKLESLAGGQKKDNTLTFEELGVDRLFVDEAHYFKNLFYVSKMTRIAGLPQTASERAFDMFLKVRHIQAVNGGGGVVFATGTPISNSMAEMFTMQRYLQPQDLQKHGLQHFDSWAATFGEPVTAMELAPDGAGYRVNTRFARFVNVPELMQLFRQMADVQTAQMLNLPRPKLDGEKPAIRSAPATPELKEFVQSLVERVERMKTARVDPKVDNMLKITGEGRKGALDLRLVLADAKDDPQSKVNLAVENIYRIWVATKENRSTQLVFCDLSTPRDEGFSVYRDMEEKLVKRGVPREEIAFIHNFDSDAAKAALFHYMRAGKIRITFGSTSKMGSGTNVQERLIALHHLDAPWRPSDVEQREGRILRQGNRNPVVQIYRYVTKGSFDAYMWQTLETKAKFITQVMSGDMSIRRVEDLDSTALTYAEVKAIASGNPLVIEKAQVDAELLRLTRLSHSHAEEQYRLRVSLRHAHEEAQRYSERLANLRQDLVVRQDTSGDKFRIELEGEALDNRAVAGELLLRKAAKVRKNFGADQRVGKFAGFDLFLRPNAFEAVDLVLKGKNHYTAKVTDTAQGTIRSLESEVQGLEAVVTRLEADIRDSQKRAKELESKVGVPFEHEKRYHELVQRQAEIEEKLDLTKNQALSQVEDAAEGETEEKISPKQTEAKSKTRRAVVRV